RCAAVMRWKSGSRAALGLRQPQCFVVFHCYFLPEFARGDRSRLRVHTSSGCSSGAKGLWARKKLMVPRRGLRSRTRETQSCASAVSLFWDCYSWTREKRRCDGGSRASGPRDQSPVKRRARRRLVGGFEQATDVVAGLSRSAALDRESGLPASDIRYAP